MEEIIKADQSSKIKVFIFMIIIISIFLVLNFILFPQIRFWIEQNQILKATKAIKIILVALFIGIIPFAIQMAIIAIRIIKSKQFPYPNQKVIKDTKIIYGEKAELKGKILLILSILLIIFAIYSSFFSINLIDSLLI